MIKKALSLMLVFAIAISLIIFIPSAEAVTLTSWDFNSEGNPEGWVHNENISAATVENGYLALDIIGGDANITSPMLSFDADSFSKFEFTYRNATEDTNAAVYFTTSDGGWSGERGLVFTTIADGQWHTVTVDLSQNTLYNGTVTQIRIDPTQNGSGCFEIDKLRFISNGEHIAMYNFSVDGNFENWSANTDMNICRVENGALSIDVSGHADPNITNSNISVDTAIYKKLYITYRNATNNNFAQLYWAGLSEGLSEAKCRNFTTVNDGDWHTVCIDLSAEEGWADTVKTLRFDPVRNATGIFEIDEIVLLSENAPFYTGATNVMAQIGWEFSKNSVYDGWTDCNDVIYTNVADGSITFGTANANDPFVCSPQISLDAGKYTKMELSYRSTIDNNKASLFFRSENKDFNANDCYSFDVINDGNWNCLEVDLTTNSNWKDIITRIRLDFAHNGTGVFEIDHIRFISPVEQSDKICTTMGGNTTLWAFMQDDNMEGWSLGADVANYDVANGNLVTYIAGGSDPYVMSPDISMDSSKYKIVEIKYKNETGNNEGRIYWERNNGGIDNSSFMEYESIPDGKWHTVRLDLSKNPYWYGNITKLRIDPTTGGVGHYYIDRVAFMDYPSRYTLSNGYIFLSGVNGSIDALHFDPDGKADYGENHLMGELYMGLKYNNVAYSSSCSDVNWVITDNTLTINNITFGSSQVRGKWTIKLDGNKLDNTFVITSGLSAATTFYDLGYCYDMVWDNEGFEVENENAGALRVPFSKIISNADRYHTAYAYKRMPSFEDETTLGFTGNYIDIEGANGYDFNLRMHYDTARISPVCFVDCVKFQFRNQNYSVNVEPGATIVRTLSLEVSQNTDITPEHFVSFEGADEDVAAALTEMLREFGNSREPACTYPDWAEWISTIRAWQDDSYIGIEKVLVNSYYQRPDGYVYTWGGISGWPFPDGYDTNHYIMTSANLINETYNYYVYDGDENFLNSSIDRARLAMNFLLNQFDTNYNLFRIDHPHHNGAARGVGSNYWDIVPYGNLSAYDNIYAYQALVRMSEIERKLGNIDRADELSDYASKLKKAYNELFWAGDHYIQVIDANGQKHDYGCVYLNLEAITYGLADESRAKTILDFMSNTVTSSGEADVFSEFVFAPRVTMYHNPSLDEGGWYCCVWPGGDAFGSEQIQNGGTIFYIAYYELMSRIKAYGADNTYDRLKEIIARYNVEHLQGGTLATGEVNQHHTSGLVGCWGEFPENGLVPVAAKNGFMGISADMQGLDITPNMPSSGMTSLTVNRMNYHSMHLDITTTATSVRIKATKNDNKYNDWVINGQPVSGNFDVTVDIKEGQTVSLYRVSDKYSKGDSDLDGEVSINDATIIQRALAQLETLSYEQKITVDANGDGVTSVMDATLIQKYIAKLIDKL